MASAAGGPKSLWTLVAAEVWRRTRRRLRAGPRYRWRFTGRMPERVLVAPPDLRLADPQIAHDIYCGRFPFSGHMVETGGESPFQITVADRGWSKSLHGFRWLRHMRAAGTELAVSNARALVADWIAVNGGRIEGVAWDPGTVAKRIIAWLQHSNVVLQGADIRFYRLFLRSLAVQIRYLRWAAHGMPDGKEKLRARAALAFAASGGHVRDVTAKNLGAALTELEDEFALLPDWEERISYVIELARGLAPLADSERSEETRYIDRRHVDHRCAVEHLVADRLGRLVHVDRAADEQVLRPRDRRRDPVDRRLVRVQVQVSNRRVDVINDGVDIALRVRSQLTDDGDLVLRRFGEIRELLVASPRYLDRVGRPKLPADLEHHTTLSMVEDESKQRWMLHGPNGEVWRVDLKPILMAHDFQLLLGAARDGMGITLLPETACADAVHRGELEVVVPDWHLPMGICHAVFASRRGLLPAVRVFIDYLAETLPAAIEGSRLQCRDIVGKMKEKAAKKG